MISATRYLSYMQCFGCRSKFSNIQKHSVARAIARMGRYTGIHGWGSCDWKSH